MGKETVLALLLREKGHFVSGEAVSAELGITRAAIWKSISALRAQGYEIDAVTGRGYCLKSARHADRADRAQLLGTCRNRRQAHRLL